MSKPNAGNERVKRDYVRYLAEAKGRDGTTVDRVLKSLERFELTTRRRDFKAFNREQAVAFKRKLSEALNARSGELLSKATILSTLRDLHAFFFWLAHVPGYKSHIAYSDADYFNLSDKDVAIARATREKPLPTLAQVEHVLTTMPAASLVERRNRAVLAFAVVTGARAAALASFRLGDVNTDEGWVDQDARHVKTKFSKTFRTILMPVSQIAMRIALEWHAEMTADPRRGPHHPLFPATEVTVGEAGAFAPTGLASRGWSGSGPVREAFRSVFQAAGLPYFNPHSIRHMLVRHIMTLDLPLETLKSWSQNLGHQGLLTTLTSYGQVPLDRQAALIRQGLPTQSGADARNVDPRLIADVIRALRQPNQRS
jgi:integrase